MEGATTGGTRVDTQIVPKYAQLLPTADCRCPRDLVDTITLLKLNPQNDASKH